MRGVGRHLQSLLLSLCILSSLASCADFSGCYPSERAERFWLSQEYLSENPFIADALIFRIYSFQFSGSLSSMELEGARTMEGEDFLRSLPENGKGFEKAASSLDSASSSLSCARQSSQNAQSLSSSAKAAAESAFGAPALLASGLLPPALLEPAMRIADFASYAFGFEAEYFSALGCAADSFDSVNDAGRAVSSKAQSDYVRLSLAGAGSDAYSGSAKETYLYARSLLHSGGACGQARESSSAILAYFRQAPHLPGYSSAGFSEYLNSAAGKTNSSIYRLALLSSELAGAYDAMELGYQTALGEAKSSEKRLSEEVSSLSKEELYLIGDLPTPSEPAGTITVGMGYGGIESAWRQSSLDLGRAQDEISLAESSHKSKAQDYLAIAIARAKAAHAIASNAQAAAGAARADASSAASFMKAEAQHSIARAEGAKANATPGSLASAEAYNAASALLDKAKEAFSSAERAVQLGRRYSGFAQSQKLAGQSYMEFKGESKYASVAGAADVVDGLEGLAEKAQKDGLDVSYEKGRAEDYRRLLSGPYSPALSDAISSSAQDDMDSLVLRLYAQYSFLEGEYSGALSLSRELEQAGQGADCNLEGLAPLFPSGRLDALLGAGKLAKAKATLESCESKSEKLAPAALSAVLTQNAEVRELSETPILGSPTLYEAEISTSNPTQLSYNGKVGFSVPTSNPLYSAEISGSDLPADAYPDQGKVRIIVPSVLAGERFSYKFKKAVQPAQKTGSDEECLQSGQHSASMQRGISFVSTRQISALLLAEQAPSLSHSAYIAYNGARITADPFESSGQTTLSGSIENVAQGKGSLTLHYLVRQPFTASISEAYFESLALGEKRGALQVEISDVKIDCPAAEVAIHLPYSGISGISISCTQGCSGAMAYSRETLQNGTRLSARLPVLRGVDKRLQVSFTLVDSAAALSEALLLAEQQVASFNRTSDKLLLSEAKALASANRTSDALSVLTKMRQDAGELSLLRADYAAYSSERSLLSDSLSSLAYTRDFLIASNSTDAASTISGPLSKCLSSLEAADADAQGKPLAALSALRKAKALLYSSLAEGAWDYISGVSSSISKAKKTSGEGSLSSAGQLLSEAERLYAQGEFAQALIPAAQSSRALSGAISQVSQEDSALAIAADALRQEYASLKDSSSSLFASYSAQYSAVSSQGRKKLPITPSELEKAVSDADKGIAASQKPSASNRDSLAAANSSYQKLASTVSLVSSAMESLRQSATSSLAVARAALSEAKAKVGESKKGDVDGIGREVESASALLSSGQYGESLSASDRAIKAANAALSGSSQSIDPKALLLGGVSLVFIAAAAYHFLKRKKPPLPQGKKEVKKADPPEGGA